MADVTHQTKNTGFSLTFGLTSDFHGFFNVHSCVFGRVVAVVISYISFPFMYYLIIFRFSGPCLRLCENEREVIVQGCVNCLSTCWLWECNGVFDWLLITNLAPIISSHIASHLFVFKPRFYLFRTLGRKRTPAGSTYVNVPQSSLLHCCVTFYIFHPYLRRDASLSFKSLRHGTLNLHWPEFQRSDYWATSPGTRVE